MERRLSAVFAVDMVGYSRLVEADEVGTIERQKVHRQELIDPAIGQYQGRVVKEMGDGILVEFPSVVNAVQCALDIQRAMPKREAAIHEDHRIAYRIGINLGDVLVENGDLFGDGVNVAARLEQLSEPGGICLSEDAYRQVGGRLPGKFSDGGLRNLKNITRLVRVYHYSGNPNRPISPDNSTTYKTPAISLLVLLTAGLVVAFVYQFGGDFRPGGSTATKEADDVLDVPPILAVLPFADQSADQDGSAYFSQGITEELINLLGRFHTLRVMSRSSTFQDKESAFDPSRVKNRLGADYLIDGSVRRQAERVRISARVTNTENGLLVWSENFDGQLTDIFEIQQSIATKIAGSVATSVLSEETQRKSSIPTPDLSAYDVVLRARAGSHTANCRSNREYRKLVTRAIEQDPSYGLPHAMMSEALVSQIVLGCTEFRDQVRSEAERYARKAISLSPQIPEGYRALGWLMSFTTDSEAANWEQMRTVLAQAVELNPSDSNSLALWGMAQLYSGNFPEAIMLFENAMQLDVALEPLYLFDAALAYYMARRHADSLRVAEQVIANHPNLYLFGVMAAVAAAQEGLHDKAAEHIAAIRPVLHLVDYQGVTSGFKDPQDAAYWTKGLNLAGL